MAWVLTTSLARMRSDFNATFPNRDKESDGTIGDPAHQAEVSGHNPDDTFGSLSEYTDTDAKQEVRAFDCDNDFRDPHGINMQDVVNRMLATSQDRNRLMYIIYNRQIWRKRNNWSREVYTGTSAHTEHAHFSGDPGFDEDGSEWTSITSFQEDDEQMGASFPPAAILPETTSITIPPVERGLADPRQAWINVCNDTFGMDYGLRIWVSDGLGNFSPLGNGGGLFKLVSGVAMSAQLPAGVRCISMKRMAVSAEGAVVPATAELPSYAGPLTYCIERGKALA